MKKNTKINLINGFTLVELLAVIVILAIILVIAVPKIMSVIENSKKATLESTAKMILNAAEKAITQNTILSNNKNITCESIVNINSQDYEYCSINFDNNVAEIILKGKGKFEGLNICKGTSVSSNATEDECTTFFVEDSWDEIVNKVKLGVYPYQVGDTKTIDLGETLGRHTIRVANTTPCSEVSILSNTACGFVLEFADIITTHAMNGTDSSSSTNVGGWPASEMRTYVNSTIYNVIPEKLRNGIIDTYVISSHGDEDITTYENVVNGNFYSIDKLYLLSTMEVWGSSGGGYDTSAADTITRQLDYYATYEGTNYTGVSITNYKGAKKYNGSTVSEFDWWLRSGRSDTSSHFYRVGGNGRRYYDSSFNSIGVSPAFRLGE